MKALTIGQIVRQDDESSGICSLSPAFACQQALQVLRGGRQLDLLVNALQSASLRSS
jgi:hypothetical protein